jgi:hypothetical protein
MSLQIEGREREGIVLFDLKGSTLGEGTWHCGTAKLAEDCC